ncbi:MAG: hypothetical protein FWC28_07900 [Proteobacteria bacterium]|nr:hypothetical protein [Cystobacterineae bacterium]MCL2315154.1 hypothetical protein [Pseudomonadota bacterium]
MFECKMWNASGLSLREFSSVHTAYECIERLLHKGFPNAATAYDKITTVLRFQHWHHCFPKVTVALEDAAAFAETQQSYVEYCLEAAIGELNAIIADLQYMADKDVADKDVDNPPPMEPPPPPSPLMASTEPIRLPEKRRWATYAAIPRRPSREFPPPSSPPHPNPRGRG